jgi:hypothetical protein
MPMIRLLRAAAALAFAAAAAAVTPAVAGQPISAIDLSDAAAALPPPANTGKPAIVLPPPGLAYPEPKACLPALPCGTRLFGAIRKNGAVELQVPAWRW